MNNGRILSDKKMLCAIEGRSIYCKGDRIYLAENKREEQFIGILPAGGKYRMLSSNKIARRMLRLDPRCGVFIDRRQALISMHGNIYHVDTKKRCIQIEHTFRKSMNHPLAFTKINNLDGLKGSILYGEYFGNREREPVSIYKRDLRGRWEKVFTFDAGGVLHIHGIIEHSERQSMIVLTGDKDSESAIWELSSNFGLLGIWARGSQRYRCCVAFPYGRGIVYATDTPLEQNAIFYMERGQGACIHKKLYRMPGPAIYGTKLANGDMVFATSVEPDSRLKRKRYMLTYKLGEGVSDRKSHLVVVDSRLQVKEVFCADKDLLPMLLFQFGNFQFPHGWDQSLAVTGQSLRGIDGKTLLIEY